MEEKIKNILDKMKKISYGWVDLYDVIHRYAHRQFFLENYHFMAIDKVLEKRVGTCFEQTALVSYYLEQENILNHTFMIIYNDPNKIARHTVCIAEVNNNFYLMESAWLVNEEEKVYSSYEEILLKIVKRYPKMYKIDDFNKDLMEIYEYTDPKPGMTYEEFSENARKGKKIIIDI